MIQDIRPNWKRSFYERHTTLCEFLSILFMLIAFTALTFFGAAQLDPYCMQEFCWL